MKKYSSACRASCFALALLAVARRAGAINIDENRTLEFTGKAQTRVSLRLQDSEGFTAPANISVGNLVQWRNIAYLEVQHDLKNLMGQIDVMKPLQRWGVVLKYRIVGRFMYEAV